MSPYVVVLVLAVVAFVGRIWVPWADAPRGAVVRRVPLSLLGRLRRHAVPGCALMVVGVAGWATGLIPLAVAAMAPIAVAVVVALPFRYTLTTEGIAAGRTPARRWTEFGGVVRRRGGVRLQGIAGSRGQTIWLSGNREDDEFVRLLRQLVRGAYKGHLGPATTDLPTPGEITPLRPFEQVPASPS